MSSRNMIKLPNNKRTAEDTLSLFNENAVDWSNKEAFSCAVSILYDGSFTIKQDQSTRMYFNCTVCKKDMNCTSSLQAHAFSGTHLKCVELNPVDHIPRRKSSKYEKNSLQYKLDTSSPIVVGLEKVEAFLGEKGRRYYKCTLCGAHGNVESMFRHVLGDKHTDKYIKAKIELRNATITADERNKLRKILADKEGYGIRSIKTIIGREYYPYEWERDGRTSARKKKLQRRLATEKIETAEPDIISITDFQTGDSSKPKIRSAKEDFEYLLDRFKFIIATHQLEETKFQGPEDLRMALIIMVFSLFWLHYANHSFLKYDQKYHGQFSQQKEVLQRCMGYVIKNLGDTFNSKYPERAVALRESRSSRSANGNPQRTRNISASGSHDKPDIVVIIDDLD